MKNRCIALVITVALFTVVACEFFLADPIQPLYETTSAGILVDLGNRLTPMASIARSVSPMAAVGTVSDVTRISVIVSGDDRFGVYQAGLATLDLTENPPGVWTGVIAGLSIGPTLTFTTTAYNATDEEVFSGVTTQVLTGFADSVSIDLLPTDDGSSVLLPRITAITIPDEFIHNQSANIDIDVDGAASETISFNMSAGAGAFIPESGSLVLPLSGAGSIVVGYAAPDPVGTYVHAVTATNSQGNSVSTTFQTVVVYDVTSPSLSVVFGPVLTAVSAQRSGATVTWTAEVYDDGDPNSLVYSWSFSQFGGTAGAVFSDPSANPSELIGYDESVVGDITLELTDDEGLTTTITFLLPVGQFPDNLIIVPGRWGDLRWGQDVWG